MSDPWGQPQQSSGDWSVPQNSGESGSLAPPPVDPQYGGAPQYGAPQPQQSQYGAPQQPVPPFGATGQQQYSDQPPYGGQPGFGAPAGQGGYGGYVPPEQKNGFSIAGFVLCFLPVLGIIFSILGPWTAM